MVRVAVFGAAGRMGAAVCAAVEASDDLELAAAVDPVAAGLRLSEVAGAAGVSVGGRSGLIEVTADPDTFKANGVEVAVDFTVAKAAYSNLSWCAKNGVHAVCGTTGLSRKELEELERAFGGPEGPNAVLAPNFSIGAIMMMRCAEACAPYFAGVEIVELHHEHKRDAPSGTSLETARRIDAARAAALGEGDAPWADDPTETFALEGSRGASTSSGLRLHSVRLPGLVAHQQVLFGSLGETLTIRHDSYDRTCYTPGVLLAVRKVRAIPGLTVGLETLLT